MCGVIFGRTTLLEAGDRALLKRFTQAQLTDVMDTARSEK